jgi:hypothetical protein
MLRYFWPIGIDRYHHLSPRLRFAARDAEAFRALFEQLGFESEPAWRDEDFGYGTGVARDLQLHLGALRARFEAAGGGVLVIYLAGHGATATDGFAVLFKPHGREEDLKDDRATSYIHVQKDLNKPTSTWSKVEVFIIHDICRTTVGEAEEGDVRARLPGPSTERKYQPGAAMLYAALPGRQSFEIDSRQGGQFRLASEPVLQALYDKPRRIGAREFARLSEIQMASVAQGHVDADILYAQKTEYKGQDVELISDEDCARLNNYKRDLSLITRARLHPENRGLWDVLAEGLSADSPFHAEVEQKLQQFSAPGTDGRPKWRTLGVWLLTTVVALSASVFLYQGFTSRQESVPQPLPPRIDNPDDTVSESDLREHSETLNARDSKLADHNTVQGAQVALDLDYKDAKGGDQDDTEASGRVEKAADSNSFELITPSSSQAAPRPLESVSVLPPRPDSCPVGQALHGKDCRGVAKKLTLAEALAHARTTDGYRLPTRSEMANIEFCSTPLAASGNAHSSGLSEASACSLARQFQNGAPSGNYWTSSTSDDYPQYHIAYNTEYRTLAYYHPQERFYVTLIRNE